MHCPQCNGARYRDEILDVTYRGRNIADVLEMTVREAFTFFRGQPKVAGPAEAADRRGAGLRAARAAGQHALRRRGPAAETGRLHERRPRGRSLFILDEPTTGLHFSDVVQLLDCFDALLAVGHSLLVVEHNLQIMRAADYIIDLVPARPTRAGRCRQGHARNGRPHARLGDGGVSRRKHWRKSRRNNRSRRLKDSASGVQ